MQELSTSDFYGQKEEEEEDSYPFPIVYKKKSRDGSATGSGQSTPGVNGRNGTLDDSKASLSEGDLAKADYVLSHRKFSLAD